MERKNLKEFYYKLGHNDESYERLETNSLYLMELCADTALDLDFYIEDKSNEMPNVQELADIINKYQKKFDKDNSLSPGGFPLKPLLYTMQEYPRQKMIRMEHLSLEMKELGKQLDNAKNETNNANLKHLLDFCCRASRYFSAHFHEQGGFKRYVA